MKVFVYGTLMPGELRWRYLEPFVDGEPGSALIDGVLWDTGYGWPALTAGDKAVSGYAVNLRCDREAEALATLDAIEGTNSGLFERVEVMTHDGDVCWTYRWPGAVEGFTELGGAWIAVTPPL